MSILSDILSGLGKQSYESRIEARIYNKDDIKKE